MVGEGVEWVSRSCGGWEEVIWVAGEDGQPKMGYTLL